MILQIPHLGHASFEALEVFLSLAPRNRNPKLQNLVAKPRSSSLTLQLRILKPKPEINFLAMISNGTKPAASAVDTENSPNQR